VIELRGVTWDHPRGVAGVRAAAEAFAVERPDVRVTWEARSLQAFADEPVDALGRRYDLIVLDHPSIGEAVEREALLPLDEHLDAAFLQDQDASSVGRSAESYRWNGHRWALAVDAAAQVGAFREDLFGEREIPTTWDDVIALGRSVREDDRWVAMPAIPVDAICAFLAICAGLGEEPCRTDRVVSRDVGREAARVLASVLEVAHPESRSLNPPRTFERMASTDEIVYVPLAFGYVNFATRGEGRRALAFSGGPAGEDGMPRGTLGGAGIAVSSSTREPEAACAYAAFACSAEIQSGPYVDAGGQPGHRSAWLDASVNTAHGDFFAHTLTALDAAYLRERHDGFIAFQTDAGETLHTWLADATPGEGVDAMLDALDERFRASLPKTSTAGSRR
jgi:multiple sugar transport system substrate-binding protein